MDAADHLCLIRGGGDLGTGVAWRLTRAGFPVVVAELAAPLTVRRRVAVSSAVADGSADIEGMIARFVESAAAAARVARSGEVGVFISPGRPDIDCAVVVDARVAKRNIDTTIDDAPCVVALGPGFVAGVDCHAVVETKRGPRLGRVLWEGAAAPDTGTPGSVGGRDVERVLRAPVAGIVRWEAEIGSIVAAASTLGVVDRTAVTAPFAGVVRGLIADGTEVDAGVKIGDVDPRPETAVAEISDKALAVGGGVLEAVMTWLHRSR